MDITLEAKSIARREGLDYRDLVQESVMRQMCGRKSISGPMQDYAKRERQHRVRLEYLEVMGYDAGSQAKALAARIDVAGLLANLSGKHREAVVFYHIFGMTETELAKTLSVSVETANARRFHGLKKLKRIVQK